MSGTDERKFQTLAPSVLFFLAGNGVHGLVVGLQSVKPAGYVG